MRKRKVYTVIVCIVAIFIIVFKVSDIKSKKDYEKIHTSIPKDSTVLEYNNTHGGFNGDGESYVVIQLTEQGKIEFIDSANKSGKWSSLPLPKEIQPIIFGGTHDT